MNKVAPIVLFTFNRLNHTIQTVDALKKNELADRSELIVFSDGPKDESSELKVEAVRKYLKTITGFKKIEIIENEKNQGLSRSIIHGVTKIVNEYGRIIVLEDDILTSPHFLRFMNDGLKFYENEEKVISIHGYSYPVNSGLPDYFFLKGADCWGWATWNRGWKLFESNGEKLLEILLKKKLADQFDYYGAAGYLRMLKDQISGKNDSWAVRWYASAYILDRLTLYPGKSMVINTGLDGSGIHCGESEFFNSDMMSRYWRFTPVEPVHSEKAYNAFRRYFIYLRINSLYNKMMDKISFYKPK